MALKLLPILLLPCCVSAQEKPADNVRAYWFQGAGINPYELPPSRCGEEHRGHAELIFATEPFLLEPQVKHETGLGESTDVLKLNALRTFNTGPYSYRTMTSTFQPIDLVGFPHILREWREAQSGSNANTHACLTHRPEHSDYWNQNTRADASSRRILGLSPDPK